MTPIETRPSQAAVSAGPTPVDMAEMEALLLRVPAHRPQDSRLRPVPVLPAPRRVSVMGLDVHAVTPYQVVDRVFASLRVRQGGWVVTPNLNILRQAREDPELRAAIEDADLAVADGVPLVWASRVAGDALPGRVNGTNLMLPIARRAAFEGKSVFLLGGNEGTADAAAEELRREVPGLEIAGTCCPPFGFESSPVQLAAIRRQIRETRPDIVFVGLGAPKQERLIRVLRKDHPNAWYFGIGVSLSFLAGEVRRAPAFMQRTGLEWLHRLAQEPRRLARRYLVECPPWAVRLGVWAIGRRFTRTVEVEMQALPKVAA